MRGLSPSTGVIMPKYKQASEIKVGVIGYGGAFNMGKATPILTLPG